MRTRPITRAARWSLRTLLLALLIGASVPAGLWAQRPDRDALGAAQKMHASRASSSEVAAALQRRHRQSGAQTTAILKIVGYDASASVTGVRSAYRPAFAELAGWMQSAGFEATGTVGAMRAARAPVDQIVSGLLKARAEPAAVAGALRRHRVSSTEAVSSLARAGIDARTNAAQLSRGGYLLEDLRVPIRSVYKAPAEWLPALTSVMKAEATIDVTDPRAMVEEAQAMELQTEDAVAWMVGEGIDPIEALVAVTEAGYPPEEVGDVAVEHIDSEAGATQLASRLKSASVVISTVTVIVGVVLAVVTFGAVVPVVVVVLLAAGFGVGATMGAMENQGYAPDEIVAGLVEGGVQGVDIAMAAKNQAVWGVMKMMRAMIDANVSVAEASSAGVTGGYSPGGVAEALIGLQLTASDLEDGLSAVISSAGLSLPDAASLLVDAGADPERVGAVLDGSFTYNDETIALYLKVAGMTGEEMAVALHQGVGTSVDDVAKILRSQGFSWEDTWDALEDGLSATDQEAAAALQNAGMSLAQLLSFLTTVQQIAHDTAMAIIENIGGEATP